MSTEVCRQYAKSVQRRKKIVYLVVTDINNFNTVSLLNVKVFIKFSCCQGDLKNGF